MLGSHQSAPAQPSYLATALRQRPNRHAALVTVAIAAAVFAFSQRPLPLGVEIDLRSDARGPRDPLQLVGFGDASNAGRRLIGTVAQPGDPTSSASTAWLEGRIVSNRPFPESFTLWAEGRAEGRAAALEVEIGAFRGSLRLDAQMGRQRLEVPASSSTRLLVFRVRSAMGRMGAPVSTVSLRRLILQ